MGCNCMRALGRYVCTVPLQNPTRGVRWILARMSVAWRGVAVVYLSLDVV